MKKLIALLLFAVALKAQNTNNDSSCDIGVAPAATLLLPYFEVETAAQSKTTLFTVTNVSAQPHAAHVTLWTDYDYPALTFNLYLTPYDVQPINLYDVIVNGVIAADAGPIGGTCANLPRVVPPQLLREVRTALTAGTTSFCNGATNADRIGGDHGTLAVGYATIDVVKDCSSTLATTMAYFREELLFDNVFIGDYEAIDPARQAATGSPLVHVRAVPEGGPAGADAVGAPFHTTFYSRYLGNLPQGFDRRQPLPSAFGARYLQLGDFETRFKIWREGTRGALAACSGYAGTAPGSRTPTRETAGNSAAPVTDIVRFDEHENAFSQFPSPIESPSAKFVVLPAASSLASDDPTLPPLVSIAGDRGGWIYFNLDSTLGARGPTYASQNWVVTSMSVPNLFEVDMDAAWFGNGCSVIPRTGGNEDWLIGPAGLTPVCPENSRPEICHPDVAPYIGTNRNP
ncbi:MAG: hypothetical protein JOZ54_10830 [Acidobacteria bacterium]|nr:hypothetical protein [Acidobacteriota bacterium]